MYPERRVIPTVVRTERRDDGLRDTPQIDWPAVGPHLVAAFIVAVAGAVVVAAAGAVVVAVAGAAIPNVAIRGAPVGVGHGRTSTP
ncbi:hypothetical protein JCM18237_07720 [Halorubrum luteum]